MNVKQALCKMIDCDNALFAEIGLVADFVSCIFSYNQTRSCDSQ